MAGMMRGQCHVQGHALFTRQAGGLNPCPQIDFTGGFNSFMAAAFGIESVQGTYGQPFSKLLLLTPLSVGIALPLTSSTVHCQRSQSGT